MMPDIDGWTVLAALRGDPELADIPVVMARSSTSSGKGMALGASGYLTKPIDREQLIAMLRRYRARAPGRRASCWSKTTPVQRERMSLRWLEPQHWLVGEAENGRVALDRLADEPRRTSSCST